MSSSGTYNTGPHNQPSANAGPDAQPSATAGPDADKWPAWATEKVRILPPDPAWAEKAAQARQELQQQLSSFNVTGIEHIGSTAVPGLPAKPIIDLIATIP